MKPRAVIVDIYQTLLDVLPPPDCAGGWERLWERYFNAPPPLDMRAFARHCDRWITEEHNRARARGISCPEVYWPRIACLAAPDLARLDEAQLDQFLLAQAGLWHQTRLAPGAAETLAALSAAGVLLGIASNAQPYTAHELDECLAGAGLDFSLFHPRLCFWSFEHGFSKPDPHVFRLLAARLWAMNVPPEAALMVGDRLDNDIEPAREQGWQVWRLGDPALGADGLWEDLRGRLV